MNSPRIGFQNSELPEMFNDCTLALYYYSQHSLFLQEIALLRPAKATPLESKIDDRIANVFLLETVEMQRRKFSIQIDSTTSSTTRNFKRLQRTDNVLVDLGMQ